MTESLDFEPKTELPEILLRYRDVVAAESAKLGLSALRPAVPEQRLLAPVTEADLDGAEERIGLSLTDEVRDLYRLYNGPWIAGNDWQTFGEVLTWYGDFWGADVEFSHPEIVSADTINMLIVVGNRWAMAYPLRGDHRGQVFGVNGPSSYSEPPPLTHYWDSLTDMMKFYLDCAEAGHIVTHESGADVFSPAHPTPEFIEFANDLGFNPHDSLFG